MSPMDNRLLRPAAPSPETDPPVQLKAENNAVLLTESGLQLTTE
jgi:hypothetical protein